MTQLFFSVSLLFLFFSLVYSLYLYFATGYYQGKLISAQRDVIQGEGVHKFDTIFNETMSLVNDYFDLTMQIIERDSMIIMDRLSQDDKYKIHPVRWEQGQSKSQDKSDSVVMYHKEYQQL